MSSSENERCLICNYSLIKNGDLLKMECGHIYHRTCAENRSNNIENIDCCNCGKKLAIGEALKLDKIKAGIQCSLCQNPLDSKDDLVTTACSHRYHRMCVKDYCNNKQNTNCCICGKESALDKALDQDITITDVQCSICENYLDRQDDVVTIACDHKCHRTCAESRPNTRHRRDCRICHKASVDGQTLDQDKMATRNTKTREPYHNQPESNKNVSYLIVSIESDNKYKSYAFVSTIKKMLKA